MAFLVQLVIQQPRCGAISTPTSSNTNHSPVSFMTETSGTNTAGSTSLENTGNSEMMGLAVFSGDKLVGELSAEETLCHLLIGNNLESCNITIPNPDNKDSSIDLLISNKSKPKFKVKIVNGTPFISLKLKLEAKVLSVNNTSDFITEEKLSEISASANQYIKTIICNYLYRTSKEFSTDIDGFGKYALPLFKTVAEYEEYNWLENFKNSFFDVTVDTNVQSAFLLSGK